MAWQRKSTAEEREEFSREAIVHLDHLYRVALHLAKDVDDAQDLVQETYARAFGFYKQFVPGTNMRAWLTRILYNCFFDHYHQKKKWTSVEGLGVEGLGGPNHWEWVPTDNPDPEGHVLRGEMSTEITDALRKIPEEFRAPIILVDMGDFSYAEAAEILSCPLGTIRSRLSRGRRLLYQYLRDYIRVQE